jgi:type II secretory pathway component PulK
MRNRSNRNGAILVAAMLMVFALASMVMVLCSSMAVEATASANQAASLQASQIEHGAEQYVLGLVSDTTQSPLSYDESYFQAIQVGDGYFWIVRPDYQDDSLPLFGLVDECGKLDINSANYDQLMHLPGMTDALAASIVNWRSPDASQASGAGDSYYASLPQPYQRKADNFETVEELLLVGNMTPQILYGDGSAPPLGTSSNVMGNDFGIGAIGDAQLSRGLFDLLTCYSFAQAATTTTQQTRRGTVETVQITNQHGRVNVNTAPASVLYCLDGSMSQDDVNKLIAARPSLDSVSPSDNNAAVSSTAWVAQAVPDKYQLIRNRICGLSYRYSADIIAVSGNGRAFKRVRIVVDTSGVSGTNATGPKIIYRRDLSDRGWPLDPAILTSMKAGQGPGNTGSAPSMTGGMGL